MKTVTCDFFSLYGTPSLSGEMDLLLFSERFPLWKASGARVIHVRALALTYFCDKTFLVDVGVNFSTGRSFLLKVRKPRKAKVGRVTPCAPLPARIGGAR